MKASGMGHLEWTLEQSRGHQAALRDDPLSAEMLAEYRKMTEDSLAEQRELEAATDQSFEEYLSAYRAD